MLAVRSLLHGARGSASARPSRSNAPAAAIRARQVTIVNSCYACKQGGRPADLLAAIREEWRALAAAAAAAAAPALKAAPAPPGA